MVADDYFDLRSRLGTALFSLGRVADLSGLKPSRLPVVKSLVEGLRDPFVFVVAGEVNAGKSTLLNALFGEEFCAAGVLPETKRIHWFRYERTPRRITKNRLLEEIGLPHAFLRDFHVVDTPGVNSIEDGHELITGDVIPRADAVLYCFPATNPWSAAGWDFLERIHRDWLKKIVLVLQQSDLRTPEEVVSIAEHMKSIARQRLGMELPVFPVSARLALLAKTSGVDKTRLLAASAFPELEHHLTGMVAGTPARMSRLVSACSAGQAMLAEVQSRVEMSAQDLAELVRVQQESQEILTSAQAGTGEAAGQTQRQLHAVWQSLTSSALEEGLAGRRGFPALLLGTDPTAAIMESRLLPPLMSAVKQAASATDQGLDQQLSGLWKLPGSDIHRILDGEARQPAEPAWPDRREVFTTLLENAACDAVTRSGFHAFWTQRLQQRSRMMRGLAMMGLLLGAALAMAVAGGHLSWHGMGVAAALAGLLLPAGFLALRRETRETAALAGPLLAAAGDQLQRATRSILAAHGQTRLADFQPFMAPLETAIRLKQQSAIPLETETGQLALTLQNLSRTLQAQLG